MSVLTERDGKATAKPVPALPRLIGTADILRRVFEHGQLPVGRCSFDAIFQLERIAFGHAGAGSQKPHRSAGSGVFGAGPAVMAR